MGGCRQGHDPQEPAGVAVPSAPDLARFVAEAESDPRFASLWRDDDTSRAYATACLALASADCLTTGARQKIYQQIATRPRRALLAELSGVEITASSLRALRKCAATGFTADDWRSLLGQLLRPDCKESLANVTSITQHLVRQLDAVPAALRLPGILGVVSNHVIAPERWLQLADALERTAPERRPSLLRSSNAIRSVATFFDYFYKVVDAARDDAAFPPAPDLGPLFQRVADARSMRREGLAMRNCLATLVDEAASGFWAYYSWMGSERATVALRRGTDGWCFDRAAGFRNASLSESSESTIRELVLQALGPAPADPAHSARDAGRARCSEGVAALGRSLFSRADRAKVTSALLAIHGRSLARDNAAFCVFECGPYYVQFLWEVDSPRYVVEVASHRSIAEVEGRLDERAVALLESTGFHWPREHKPNFWRYIPEVDHDGRTDTPMCDDEGDPWTGAADFALGVLHFIFGHRPGDGLSVKVNIPPRLDP